MKRPDYFGTGCRTGSPAAQYDRSIADGNKAGGDHEGAKQMRLTVGEQDPKEDSRCNVAHPLGVMPSVRTMGWSIFPSRNTKAGCGTAWRQQEACAKTNNGDTDGAGRYGSDGR
jgi:hypothetical protein